MSSAAGTILVISHEDDLHARAVLERLAARDADAVLFDTARFPAQAPLTIEHAADASWRGAAPVGERALELAEVRSVWWRRPQPFHLHAEVAGGVDRGFALAETHAAVAGLWSLLDARWINDPDRDEKASRKAWQLKIARAAGLTIPRTCITSDPERARAFVERAAGDVIYKAFSATEQTWRETRVLRAGERQLLDAVRFAPVIFQDYVPARVDLRITIVGERIFAAEIRSQETSYPHDFRMDMERAAIVPHALPAVIEAALRELVERLGLVYGAIDMRQTPAGEYVFLEINPAGQWLFVEQRTQQPITDALAEALCSAAA